MSGLSTPMADELGFGCVGWLVEDGDDDDDGAVDALGVGVDVDAEAAADDVAAGAGLSRRLRRGMTCPVAGPT